MISEVLLKKMQLDIEMSSMFGTYFAGRKLNTLSPSRRDRWTEIKLALQSREVEKFWPLSFGHVFISSIWLHHQKIRKFYPEKLDLQEVSNCRY